MTGNKNYFVNYERERFSPEPTVVESAASKSMAQFDWLIWAVTVFRGNSKIEELLQAITTRRLDKIILFTQEFMSFYRQIKTKVSGRTCTYTLVDPGSRKDHGLYLPKFAPIITNKLRVFFKAVLVSRIFMLIHVFYLSQEQKLDFILVSSKSALSVHRPANTVLLVRFEVEFLRQPSSRTNIKILFLRKFTPIALGLYKFTYS